MRKITREAVTALMHNAEMRSNNTIVTFDGKVGRMYLFGNFIAEFDRGVLSITMAGWNTNTTRERLSGLPNVTVRTKKGAVTLNGKAWDGSLIAVK